MKSQIGINIVKNRTRVMRSSFRIRSAWLVPALRTFRAAEVHLREVASRSKIRFSDLDSILTYVRYRVSRNWESQTKD